MKLFGPFELDRAMFGLSLQYLCLGVTEKEAKSIKEGCMLKRRAS